MMGKTLEITLNKLNEIIEQQAKRITKLVYKNKTLIKRAESAEGDWEITERIRDQQKAKIIELEGGISDAIELMDEEPAKKILMQLITK